MEDLVIFVIVNQFILAKCPIFFSSFLRQCCREYAKMEFVKYVGMVKAMNGST